MFTGGMDDVETGEQPRLYLHTRLLRKPVIGWLYAVLSLLVISAGLVAVFAILVAILSLGGCLPFGC